MGGHFEVGRGELAFDEQNVHHAPEKDDEDSNGSLNKNGGKEIW